jgi:CRP/FNR family transcriptional regulator, anaerobic regulatory protein
MSISIFTDPRLLAEIEKHALRRRVKRDEVLVSPGQPIVFLPIVISGSIRVMRQDPEGREVFLYHLYPGQTCALSLSCCQKGKKSLVKAVAEDDTEVLQIPVEMIDPWFAYPEWKAYINNSFSLRLEEMLQVIDLIAFSNLDSQLLHYLRERAKALNTKALYITHQEIADELHTHREVIGRLLRTLEQKQLVRMGRNVIEVLQ